MLRYVSIFAVVFVFALSAFGRDAPRGPVRDRSTLDVANPQMENRVTSAGNVWMSVSNWGFLGNSGPQQSDAMWDPCSPWLWAPQCEFPAGSGIQHLFQAGLWIGAEIPDGDEWVRRVSVGVDGWFSPTIREFFPGEGAENGIIERSRDPGQFGCSG